MSRRIESCRGMGSGPRVLERLRAAFWPLPNAGNEVFSLPLERVAILERYILRHGVPIILNAPGCFEQTRECLLGVKRFLLREFGLAPIDRALESIMQRALIGSWHFAQCLEGRTPLRYLAHSLEQRGSRRGGDVFSFLAQRHGLPLIVFESGAVIDKGLLALLIDGIALLAKLIPQWLLLMARYGTRLLPQELQALHGIHSLAAVFLGMKLLRTLNQGLFFRHIVCIPPIEPFLQTPDRGVEFLLNRTRGRAVHRRISAQFLGSFSQDRR